MNYSDLTQRYFEAPGHVGVLAGPGIFRGAAGSRAQGTWVQFDLKVRAGTVLEARFQAFGCPHTIAVAAWIAEQAAGRASAPLPESVQGLMQRFTVPPEKRGRLLIIEDAWMVAITPAI